MASTGLVFSHRYLQHNTNPFRLPSGAALPFVESVDHPSNPRLVDRTMQLIDQTGLSGHLTKVDPVLAPIEAVTAYHSAEYVERVREIIAKGGGDAGQGAPVGAGSFDIALLAAGGVIAAVDAVITGEAANAYALVRPPGHHAMRDKGMGFCVFGNVAIAARHAQRVHGIERVLILDWDVHCGNGTQDAFYNDANVLFCSIHQSELFPVGWGLVDQSGADDGAGRTVNVPLPGGSGDATYLAIIDEVVVPIARQFKPELIIVSAGQDASASDPLGRMSVTASGYRQMTSMIMALADELCDGRLVAAQEGGYSETYAPYCTLAIIETLAGIRSGIEEPVAESRSAAWPQTTTIGMDARAAIDAAKAEQRRFWDLP
jgi:acetoin utilization deacetylase AcuC-like enzyme